jgi:hypothetical protein
VCLGEVLTARQQRIEALPTWFLEDLTAGSVVEERITGRHFASPSVQVDISPHGQVAVVSTHEQVLGGDNGQVYTGCRFPADSPYAATIAHHGTAIGERLARRGVVGRFGVDFAAVEDVAGHWRVYALEINLRKGGTTHPFAVLRNLVPGRYDAGTGAFQEPGGRKKFYCATDNLVDGNWTGLTPAEVIHALTDAQLTFDPEARTGVVLHMLSCLAIDGRFGLTAIGDSPEQAWALQEATRRAVDSVALARA